MYKYQHICKLNNLTLRAKIQQNSIVFQLSSQQFSKKAIYQSQQIQVKTTTTLNTLFDCFQDLLAYMRQIGNVKFDEDTHQLIILGKHPTKKSQSVQLYKIVVNQKIVQVNDIINEIVNLCDKQDKIQGDVLKNIIKQIASKLLQIEHKNNQLDMSRIFTKIQYFGSEIQNLKLKTAELFSKSEQLFKIQKENIINIDVELQKWAQQIIRNKKQINNNQNALRNFYQRLEAQQDIIRNLKDKLSQDKLKQRQRQRQKIQQEKIMIPRQEQAEKILSLAQVLACLDKTAKFFRHFIVRGNNITKQDDFIFPTVLIGSKSMRDQPEFTVKARKMGIIKKIYPGVCVGIVDSKHKYKQSCDNNDNVIEYSCAGKLFQKNKYIITQGKGFDVNQLVTIKVDFIEGSVSWIVNQQLRCKHKNSQLIKAPGIDWRPYIFMRDKGDSIDWILK